MFLTQFQRETTIRADYRYNFNWNVFFRVVSKTATIRYITYYYIYNHLCLILSGTKIFHHECRFWRLYSNGGESATELAILSLLSVISESSMVMLGFDEFLRRRRSNLVCHDDERRRLSFSGVDVNSVCRGDEAAAGGDDDNGDCVGSLSSLPFITNTSSAKSQNFDEPLLSVSFWLLCSFESRFSLATAVSYEASLFLKFFCF